MHPSNKALWFSIRTSIIDINMDEFHFLAFHLFVDVIQSMKNITHRDYNTFHCSKCDGEFTECEYRYILKLSLQYHTEQINRATNFDDVSNKLISVSANILCLLAIQPSTTKDISQQLTSE